VFFVIPWQDKTLIGTTDTFPEQGANALVVQPKETAYLLEGYNHYFDPHLRADEVLGTFAGLRPLLRARAGEPSSLSREFRLHASPSGLVTALGGKFTTYRRMAEMITDHLGAWLGKRQRCRTATLPLTGAPPIAWANFCKEMTASMVQRFPIKLDSAAHLVERYGDQVEAVIEKMRRTENGFARVHAEEPDLVGEQSWQREEEMAIFPEDYFLRRSRIGVWRRTESLVRASD
jgi:glycerol-3-phosphate dehydrogenase